MRRNALSLAAAVMATVALPAVASAADAVVTTDLNMRAGPSTAFPVVDVLPADAPINVHGCVKGYSWCDVSWRGSRGWVSANFITALHNDRYVPLVEYADTIDVPVIGFSIDTYWDRYYRGRPWYGQRARWRHAFRDDGGDVRRNRRVDRSDVRERRGDRKADRRPDRSDRRAERGNDRRDLKNNRNTDRRDFRKGRSSDRRDVNRERSTEGRQGRMERQQSKTERGGRGMRSAERFDTPRQGGRGGSPQARERGGPGGGGGPAVRGGGERGGERGGGGGGGRRGREG